MDWHGVPSLQALRGLEAVARLGSYTAAAAELNVTHAAVSQSVRKLEAHFGVALIQRTPDGMAPTHDAIALCAALTDGFGRIAGAARDMATRNSTRPLRVSLTPSLAASWIMPRMGRFWTRHPEVELELLPSNRVVDLSRDGFDMAIRQGKGDWPGVESEWLMGSVHVVVAGPEAPAVGPLTDLSPLSTWPWLLGPYRQAEIDWARAHGLDLDRVRATEFADNAMLLQALRGSDRVAILPYPVVSDDLARGSLIDLFEDSETDYGYFVVTRPGHRPETLRKFVRWLRAEAA